MPSVVSSHQWHTGPQPTAGDARITKGRVRVASGSFAGRWGSLTNRRLASQSRADSFAPQNSGGSQAYGANHL
jgi:hypothetical protein